MDTLGNWDLTASLAESTARKNGADPYGGLTVARTVYLEFVNTNQPNAIQSDRTDIIGQFADDLNLSRRVGGET